MDQEKIHDAELEYDEDLVYYHNGKRFTGVAIDEEGELGRSEVEYKNGLQEGFSRDWYANDNLKAEEEYTQNVKHGRARNFFPAGGLMREDLYEYGVLLASKEWDEAGNLVRAYRIDVNSSQHEYYERMKRNLRWPPVVVE